MSAKVHCGYAYVLTFPYWICVDKDDPPTIKELSFDGIKIRVYPPFRSGDRFFFSSPHVNHEEVPFIQGRKGWKLLSTPNQISAFPGMLVDGKSNPPKDSLRIDVFRPDELPPREIHRIASRLASLIRWRTNQSWIGYSTLMKMKTQYFSMDKEGLPTRPSLHCWKPPIVTAVVEHGDELLLNDSIWSQVISDCEKGVEIPVQDVFLLDVAYQLLVTNDLRRIVIDSASACEFVFEITVERLWTARHTGTYDENVRKSLFWGYNVAKHVDEKFKENFGRSYKDDHKTEWESLSDLWEARNNVAHGKSNFYGTPPVTVDLDKGKEFFITSQHFIGWLQNLN